MTTHYEQEMPDIPAMLEELHETMTYKEIAAYCDVDGDSIGRYIDGSRQRIGFETAWLILRLYYRVTRKG